ncbi:MAG: FAD-binding domain-containing protein [Oscillochloridaceae bacterium umkhey_bin13]
MSTNMHRDVSDRAELIAYLSEQFPQAAAVAEAVPTTRGGRAAAEAVLAQVAPRRYAASRNYLNGAVTRLSAYLRHGVLSLAEVREAALLAAAHPDEASKLIQELGWRDYFQRVYAQIGDGIWQDREPSTTGEPPAAYANELPADIREGQTGLACIDAFSHELVTTGYLHNHARMWLAAYVVHWRRIAWQVGASWFLQHLLDGDPASNNLSWQWVAGTFSSKPYFFNRANLERYSDGIHCRTCPLRDHCPFDASYDELSAQLFPQRDLAK